MSANREKSSMDYSPMAREVAGMMIDWERNENSPFEAAEQIIAYVIKSTRGESAFDSAIARFAKNIDKPIASNIENSE